MKFICENCKAKYQIGDDKIAGRSVRMKCRRCGHLIQLSASVTEASSGEGPAHDVIDTSFVETGSSASLSVSALLGGAHAHAHDVAAAQLREEPEEDPTRAMTREQRAALGVRESQAGPPPTQQAVRASAPHATPAPGAARPGFGASPAGAIGVPRAAAPPGAPATGALRPGAAPLGAAARGVPVAPTAARPAAGAVIRPGPSAGVAGAFQKTLAEGTAPSDAPKPASSGAHVPHGEDWYVGVGGVPLGPVRLAVIREKALAGTVQAESLVWREGFDEWQPLKNFPELLEIVEEAQAARSGGRRPSAVPRAPTPAPPAVSSKPTGITAPSPYQAKVPAPAPATYQPKATAVGVGLPAVTLPAGAKSPLASSTTPGAPLGARPAPHAHTPAPHAHTPAPHAHTPAPHAHTPAPHAGAGIAPRDVRASVPHAPIASALGRAAIAPPGPAGRSLSVPAEPARPSNLGLRPSDTGPAAGGAFGLRLEAPGPQSSTVVSPSHAPTPAPASADLFGGVSAPPAAPQIEAPAPLPSADPLPQALAASAAALDVMRDPFAAPTSGGAAEGRAASGGAARAASEMASRPAAPVIDSPAPAPFGAPPPSEAPLSIAGLGGSRRRGGMHPVIYAFIAMAGAFGIVAAYLIFARPPQPVIVYQTMPGSPSGTPVPGTAGADTATAPASPPEVGSAEPSSGQPRPTGGGSSGTGGGPKPTGSGTSAPLDTSGFGNQVVPPPVATPTNPTSDPSLGQLSAGEIQGVVSSNQARVRKRCWQPALDSAGANASPNARVQGRIVIGPSGSVDSATASGAEKDFPGLSSCIAGQMKGWKFPPSGGSTPVNVPFVFAGQ